MTAAGDGGRFTWEAFSEELWPFFPSPSFVRECRVKTSSISIYEEKTGYFLSLRKPKIIDFFPAAFSLLR